MTNDDLKHALISLVLGVAITAATSIVNGLAHLCLQWLSGVAGATTATVSYLTQTYKS